MKIGPEIQKYKALREKLENIDGLDEACISDTLEGATDLKEAILEIDREIQERECFALALEAHIEQLEARRRRHLSAVDKLRTVILHAMDNAGLSKVEGPDATISISKRGPELHVENEAAIPSRFFDPQPPKLNKKRLREELENEAVPGVRLGNGGINLTIRRK